MVIMQKKVLGLKNNSPPPSPWPLDSDVNIVMAEDIVILMMMINSCSEGYSNDKDDSGSRH